MRVGFRPPLFVIAAILIGLIALLATLQYTWLGRISDAERESRKATLAARAEAFASDFDREVTLAYMLFQVEPLLEPAAASSLDSRLAARHDRWTLTSRFPRLLKECYVALQGADGVARMQRFNTRTRAVESVEWPAALAPIRQHIVAGRASGAEDGPDRGQVVVRALIRSLWPEIPALVVPAPMLLLERPEAPRAAPEHTLSFTILLLDDEYIRGELFPALAQQHLQGIAGVNYHTAVADPERGRVIYRSASAFDPSPHAEGDAVAELFQVRAQQFESMASDVRRFTTSLPAGGAHPAGSRFLLQGRRPSAVVVDQAARGRTVVTSVAAAVTRTGSTARWRLLVKHPSGSLEHAVSSARTRNLIISTSILGVLAASMALLVISTRRSQQIATQQMEFVAAVSHELRTPLAVIRSAGDNLAEGVVSGPEHVRKYGELVRNEGRRLSEMVEQILEFAGIQSGARRIEPNAVDVAVILDDVIAASHPLLREARTAVERDIPPDLPPVAGDAAALRRLFQNLLANAVKYGGESRWVGLRARAAGREVVVTVADRGIGIAGSARSRIFEPFYRAPEVVAAQIQGAGLGLSLVHRIVQAHGGRIDVSSAPGQGSEFIVRLPAAAAEATGADRHAAAEAARST